ncbi:MerR family transcriptional regulator [Desulfolucanica intricata]|uniref:MerR family transcriptional regulator n=1 Tax=Desulfolucanica intricata TaxID=1285191 RepID=UPI0009ED242A|nr:MerR family transcriptional regulator [Desulfolucanica intricata]
MKKYRIGEIAELAGVSKRTVDYYTKLGLLKPVPSDTKYRYYCDEALIRLRLIDGLKKQRLTLEEIKERLNLLDNLPIHDINEFKSESVSITFIKEQIIYLEDRLTELQPALANLGPGQTALTKQMLLQSMTLVQTLILYINQIASMV